MTLRAPLTLAGAALIGLVVAACNTSGRETAAAPAAAANPYSAAGAPQFSAGEYGGGACGQPIADFRNLIERDNVTGFVGPSVYKQILPEIERAGAACRGGQSAQAIAILNATKSRHGYRQ
ncbi:hypothetical protein QNA08_09900 [Chelatococcus sp. SYSU_G07232]|uniref:Lipoprotein n=1 Tax=Chelatococcus albus TaxID=3047466 RepID=A0ABT7AGQ5_9HYPH|nr:hypothetical protein [Chelatococcus sp. SYSU_G07232]MDJ1158547.1 hypothetical protein [Chelatococcus sp. SYSU_G07232]